MNYRNIYAQKVIKVGYIALAVLILAAVLHFTALTDYDFSDNPGFYPGTEIRFAVVNFFSLLGVLPMVTFLAYLPLMIRFGGYKLSTALLLLAGFTLLIYGYELPMDGDSLSAVTTVPAALLYIIVGIVIFNYGYKETHNTNKLT